jgi:hypothetical protein
MPMMVAAPLISPLAIRRGISASGIQLTDSVSFGSGVHPLLRLVQHHRHRARREPHHVLIEQRPVRVAPPTPG